MRFCILNNANMLNFSLLNVVAMKPISQLQLHTPAYLENITTAG
jgi:hypothetical protein